MTESTTAFYKALSKAQSEFPAIEKDKEANAQSFKYKYSSLDACIAKTKPILAKNGFSVSFTMLPRENNIIALVCHLTHEGGYSVTSAMEFLNNPDPKKIGSLITYYRRYLYCSMLNITSDEDIDAQNIEPIKAIKQENKEPKKEGTISDKQAKRLWAITKQKNMPDADLRSLIESFGYTSTRDIEIKNYESIISHIENYQGVEEEIDFPFDVK